MSVSGGLPAGISVGENSVAGALAFLVGSRRRLVLVVVTALVGILVAFFQALGLPLEQSHLRPGRPAHPAEHLGAHAVRHGVAHP